MEQVMGIEPTYLAWKASILPLNYTCMVLEARLELARTYVLRILSPICLPFPSLKHYGVPEEI